MLRVILGGPQGTDSVLEIDQILSSAIKILKLNLASSDFLSSRHTNSGI